MAYGADVKNRFFTTFSRTALSGLAGLLAGSTPAGASFLNSAADFAVLGATAVTNVGVTAIRGDVGVYPADTITGSGTVTLTGAYHAADPTAQQAQADARGAFGTLAALPVTADLSGQDLATVGPLAPGAYRFASSAFLTGALTLDFVTNPGGAFVFQIGSTLTTADASSVSVLNGAPGSGIFWQVGSSATIGTGTRFAGNILADQAITLGSGAQLLCGRALALRAAVTLSSNRISNDCTGDGALASGRSDFGSRGFAGSPPAVPEPTTMALFGLGALTCAALSARRRA